MSRATRYQTLVNSYGFLPSEAKILSRTSRQGMKAPYFQRFVNSRRALWLNKKRLNWSDEQYRDVIRRQYAERGAFKQDILGRLRADVWQMLRWYEERSPRREDEYESPWRKKLTKRSTARRAFKATTRKTLMQTWIEGLNTTIANPNITPERRARLIRQRDNLKRDLEKLA